LIEWRVDLGDPRHQLVEAAQLRADHLGGGLIGGDGGLLGRDRQSGDAGGKRGGGQ